MREQDSASNSTLNQVEVYWNNELLKTITIPPQAKELSILTNTDLNIGRLEVRIIAGTPTGLSIDNFLVGSVSIEADRELTVIRDPAITQDDK